MNQYLPLGKQGMAVVEGSRSLLARIRKELTFSDFVVGGDQEDRVTIRSYVDINQRYIGVPVAYGLSKFANDCNFEAFTVPFVTAGPSAVTLRPNQVDPVERIVEGFDSYYAQILQSPTGSGKTVMGCEIARRLESKTLILVDQNRLAEQWVDTLVDLFGYDPDEIGRVQGPNLEYSEYDYTVAMVQSVFNREFPEDFYEDFGLVIYDEYHTAGATQYSNVLSMFTAAYRLGLSATKRKDSKQRLVQWHLNQNTIVVKDERTKSHVRYLEYDGNIPSWYAQISPKDGRYVSEISTDSDRNELIVQAIMRLYEQGRNILVIGGRIQQLECIRSMCIVLGMEESETLLYTGSEHIWRYRKDPNPKTHPEGWERGAEYTPLMFVPWEKKVNLKKRGESLLTARVIFSTYSIFAKGVDVPHLDTGIDVTPKTSFVQIHGRILRALPGKLIPIWVTVRDICSFRAEFQFSRRVTELMKSKAEIYLWQLDKGVQRKKSQIVVRHANANAARLKSGRVSMSADGRNISRMPNTETN